MVPSEPDYEMIADGTETARTVPAVDVGGREILSRTGGGTVDDNRVSSLQRPPFLLVAACVDGESESDGFVFRQLAVILPVHRMLDRGCRGIDRRDRPMMGPTAEQPERGDNGKGFFHDKALLLCWRTRKLWRSSRSG